MHQLVPNEDVRRRVREAMPVSWWSPVTAEDGQSYYYNLETGRGKGNVAVSAVERHLVSLAGWNGRRSGLGAPKGWTGPFCTSCA